MCRLHLQDMVFVIRCLVQDSNLVELWHQEWMEDRKVVAVVVALDSRA